MNNIKLNKPHYSNKRYIIFLDGDNKFSFRNKREANDFITKIGRQIDESILMITEKLSELEQFYRLYYLADKDYKFKYNVGNSIDFITNRIAWMTEHTDSENHDTIMYQAILNCFTELESAFNLIHDKAAKRKDTITKRRCALKIDLISLFRNQLNIKIKSDINYLKIKKAE